MSSWMLDASVLLARVDNRDGEHAAAIALLDAEDDLATLDLAFYEVTNVAMRSWRDPLMAARLREMVAGIAAEGGLVRIDVDLAAAMADLAAEHPLSAYDAAYVAAARLTGAQLVSCDLRDLVRPGFAITPSAAVSG